MGRQLAELPVESFVARVVLTRSAPAIASPITERLNGASYPGITSHDASAFAHGDVVCRVEAKCGDIAKAGGELPAIGRPKGVTVVFYEPEVVFSAECNHGIEIKRIAQGVGENHGPRFVADCRFKLRHIHIVSAKIDIDEDWHTA